MAKLGQIWLKFVFSAQFLIEVFLDQKIVGTSTENARFVEWCRFFVISVKHSNLVCRTG
jgi:hypothetical protein